MNTISNLTLGETAQLLKSRISTHAWCGMGIAVGASILATLCVAMLETGGIGLAALARVQQSNAGLWILDGMPLLFAFWGQYTQTVMAFEAGAVIMDHTGDLRAHIASLEQKDGYGNTHDPLTGLPNRMLFFDRVEQATALASRASERFAVLLMDIDNFKEINDTLGHYSGDLLLKQVSVRLQSVMRTCDTIARLGGDEFAMVVTNVEEQKDAEHVAHKIAEALEAQFLLQGLSLDIRVSIGISIFPGNGANAEALIRRADVAMYTAKRSKCGYCAYNLRDDQHNTRRLSLMSELRRGIEDGDLKLEFMPKVNAITGKIDEAEALVRWQHSEHGLIMPDEFIPLAEQSGLIKPLTDWVMDNAMGECVAWREKGLEAGVSINISARAIMDPYFPDKAATLLAMHGLDSSQIVLEITESTIMADPYHAMKVLVGLGEMGFRMSIDDFGTGYSSLAYLKQLPVDEIKIDKSFVMDMMDDDNDAMIVRATIELAHNLSLQVVAEGVKDRETWKFLKQQGCDAGQGEYLGMPMAVADLLQFYFEMDRLSLLA